MPRLHLACLGNPQVRHGQQTITFRTRKTLALLIYLAVEGGMHSREKLAALFWPDSDRSSGRANLRSTLMYLRKALSHEGQSESPHLNVERDALGFNTNADYELDLALIESAAAAPQDGALQEALNSVRGGFLEGFSLGDSPQFDDWMTLQGEMWHVQLNELFDRLSQRQLDGGQVANAVQTLQRWLSLDPLQERAYRRLMQAQFQQGNRSGALQTFELCQSVLSDELGVSPAPETNALAERMRKGEAAAERSSTDAAEPQPVAGPLVGRVNEHQALVTAFHAMQQGQATTVTIEGEAGIGKTRLARAFLSWARAHGGYLLQGQAFETGGRLPYQPVVEALRPVFKRSTGRQDEVLESLSPTWLAELSRLLPELHEKVPDLAVPTGQESTAASRLFEAVVQLGVTLAAQRPLVLLIDDVQWADAASLDLLLYACRRWLEDNTTILLLLTMRSEALAQITDTSNTLRDWLYNLRRESDVTRIPLSPLTEKATHELADELVERGNVDAFARWLYRETGGQPFFITETLEALIEAGVARAVESAAGSRSGESGRAKPGQVSSLRLDVSGVEQRMNAAQPLLPAGVRDLIRQRLARLTPGARNLLSAAAVLGQTCHFRQLCQVADQEAVSSLEALDELLSAHLLEAGETSSPLAEYRFTHDKIRDVVYTEAGDARRHLFHERAFAHLRETGAPPARLAHHAMAAGLAQEAFDNHLAAGDEALDLFAVRDAIGFYRQAQRALSEAHDLQIGAPRQRHLYEKLGRAYELDNRWEAAATTYEEMLTLARARSDPELTVAALSRLAGATLMGDWQRSQAMDYLEEAQAIAEAQKDKVGLVEIHITLSQTLLYSVERDAAIDYAERALALARELGRHELVARSLNTLTYARFGPPSALSQVEAEAAEARGLFARAGNRALEADSLAMVGHVQLHTGRPHEALNTLREAQAIVLDIDNSWGQVNIASHLAMVLLELDEVDEAFSAVQSAVETGRQWGHDALVAGALNIRGAVHRARRAFDQAMADHEAAQTRFSELSFEHLPPIIAVHLCADCALAGDWDAALEYARQSLALEDLTWLWNWSDTGFFYHHVVHTLARCGDVAQAREALDRYKTATGDNPRYRLPYLRAQAALVRIMEQEEEAVNSLQEALDLARTMALPRQKQLVLAALADLEASRGNEETAATLRRQAQEMAHTAENP